MNPGLLPLKTTLVQHVIERSPLGGFFTLVLTPALITLAKLLHRNLMVSIKDAIIVQEISEKIIMYEQAVGSGLDRCRNSKSVPVPLDTTGDGPVQYSFEKSGILPHSNFQLAVEFHLWIDREVVVEGDFDVATFVA